MTDCFVRSAPGRRAPRATRVLASVSAAVIALTLHVAAAPLDPPMPLPAAESLAGNYLAARSAGQQADLQAAARFFAEALADNPEDPFLLERTLVLSIAAGDVDGSLAYARRLQSADRDNPLAALALGIDAFKTKRWAGAVSDFKRSGTGALVGLTAEVLAAWAEAGAGEPKKALARLDKLSGEQWYAFFRSYHGGLIADLAGDHEEAVARLEAAKDIDDNSVNVLEAYIRALARAGRLDDAKRELDEAEARVPGHPLLKIVADDLAAGRTPAPQVETVSEGASEILFGLGSAIARDDTGELAVVYLRLALTLDPKADYARITLAELFDRSKQYMRSIELLAAVSPDSPMKRNAEIMIGFNYNSLDMVDEARAHLRALVDKNPADLDAVTALGNVLRVRKMFEEAAVIYSKGIASLEKPGPAHWQLFYNRGIAYERTDRWPEAEADFKMALQLRPDQPLVLNYLGYSWVDKGMNFDEALAMIRKAVELEPGDGYIVDSLGWVYYKLGRYDEAVAELEKAVDLKPEDPVINDHLGDAYWKVGRRLEARFQWSHARDRKPEPEELAKILKKLGSGLPDPARPAAADAAGSAPAAATP